MCGKDRCIYYGCDLCGLRLGLAYIIQRDECDCLNPTYAELCSQACANDYTTQILDCTCGSANQTTITRGPSTK